MLTVIIFASSKKEAQDMADDRRENLKFVRVHSRVSKGNSFYTFRQEDPVPVKEENVIDEHPDAWKQFIHEHPQWED